MPTTAATISRSVESADIPLTNERSTLTMSTGIRRSCSSDE